MAGGAAGAARSPAGLTRPPPPGLGGAPQLRACLLAARGPRAAAKRVDRRRIIQALASPRVLVVDPELGGGNIARHAQQTEAQQGAEQHVVADHWLTSVAAGWLSPW